MSEQTMTSPAPSTAKGRDPESRADLSLLELLHPDGIAKRILVIGSNCPAPLLPASCRAAGGHADVVVVAPTATECRAGGWLQKAAKLTSQTLAADGVAYVLTPPRWRLRIRAPLEKHGLSIDQAVVHLPSRVQSRYLVPLRSTPARYAFSKLLPIPPWGRFLAAAAFRFPGIEQLLERILPSVAHVVRRPGARPPFEWLFRLSPEVNGSGNVVIRTSWRGQDGAVIMYYFPASDARPSAIAKLNLTMARAADRVYEASILSRLGPGARSAGADVPQPLWSGQVNDHPVLLQTAIDGRSVASVLTSHPRRLFDVMDGVISWLERWNRSTMLIRPLDLELLSREILAPAALLSPLIEQGNEYRDWLAKRCATLTGVPVPLVATHNDLTMWNIFLGERGLISVIDWEAAREQALPLVDFVYAVTDAVLLAGGCVDRAKAFEACFTPGGAYEHFSAKLLGRLRRAVQMPDELADLCVHACWLHHAVNEYHSNRPPDSRPFLKVVQRLALNRFQVGGGTD